MNMQQSKPPASERSGLDKQSETPRQAVEAAVEEGKEALSDAAGTAQTVIGDITDEAKKLAGDATDKAREFAEENKGRAAQQLEGVTSALNRAAEELEAKGGGQFATYARDLANGVGTFSQNLKDKSVDELIGSVGALAQKQPAAFIGAAAVLGFLASRLVMASARSVSHPDHSQPPSASSDGNDRPPYSPTTTVGEGAGPYYGSN